MLHSVTRGQRLNRVTSLIYRSLDNNQFGRAEIMVDFIKKICSHSTITTLFPTLPISLLQLSSSQIKYKIDTGNFHGFFFAQTDGITFIWIPLCQFERNKRYENDNF